MNSIMEIKQKSRKDKMVTLYDRIEARTAEQTLKKIVEINMEDESYINEGKEWAHQNMVEGATFKLTPISLYLSTPGGNVYDGLALYDTIESSTTPVEIICSGISASSVSLRKHVILPYSLTSSRIVRFILTACKKRNTDSPRKRTAGIAIHFHVFIPYMIIFFSVL